MAGLSYSLGVQAFTADALAVTWLATQPRGPLTFAVLAMAGLCTGTTVGWHLSEIDLPSRTLCYHLGITSLMVTIAVVWLLTKRDSEEVLCHVTNAGLLVGFMMGHLARAQSRRENLRPS